MKRHLVIQPRLETPRGLQLSILIGSVLAGFVAVGIVFLMKGVNPFFAIFEIFRGSFGSVYGIKETITKALPLILIASGLTLAYRAKFWNIGAESQLLAGAVLSTWVGLNWGPLLPGWLVIALMALAGMLGGALWGMIPALFKVKFGISEVISTLMLNYVAAEIVKMLVVGPWKGETQMGYPYTDDIVESAHLVLFPLSRIPVFTLWVVLTACLILFILIFRTKFGYELRVVGENPEAARYAGINFFKISIIMMAISGGMAGLAGMSEIAANHHHLTYPETISAGYGFTAIIVAWLGKLNPLLVIISGMFFAGIVVGGDAIQISLGLPAATVDIFNGVILFFLIMGEYFLHNRVFIAVKGRADA